MMSKVLIFLVAASLLSCKTASTQKGAAVVVNAEEFAAQMEKFEAEGKDYILWDIRTEKELIESGFIAGAEHVDYYKDDFKSKVEALDRDVPVMYYCRSGGRSGNARNLFNELGFIEVYDLGSGILGWLSAGKPVEK